MPRTLGKKKEIFLKVRIKRGSIRCRNGSNFKDEKVISVNSECSETPVFNPKTGVSKLFDPKTGFYDSITGVFDQKTGNFFRTIFMKFLRVQKVWVFPKKF